MHLLDTDTLTHLHAGHLNVRRRLALITDGEVAITVVTRIEILRGRFDFVLKAATGAEVLRAQGWLTRSETLLRHVPIAAFDDAAALRFDQLRSTSGGRAMGRTDLLIASIALSRRAVLVTRNVRDFSGVPGLAVENWVD